MSYIYRPRQARRHAPAPVLPFLFGLAVGFLLSACVALVVL